MDKDILIIGLGTTGMSAIDALYSKGFNIYVYDDNKENFNKCPENVAWYKGEEIDFIIKSPGIPLSNPFVYDLMKKYPIYSDIELAYRLTKCENIIAITGTNGKTTMVTLFQKVMDDANKKSYLGGNVGVGILPLALEAEKDDVMIIECSSFQLETIEKFKPKIAIISNITEDHIDHHGNVENYRNSKKNIFKNQDEDDFLILNIDDSYTAMIGEEHENAFVVSLLPIQQKGAYLSEGNLWFNLDDQPKKFMDRDELQVVGDHNVRNLLEVLLAALLIGVDEDSIRESFRTFKGVEHRIEFVDEYKKVKIYNDSKGTNPDSTIVAVDSMPGPVHLLAGGYNKGADFAPMFEKISSKIKNLYLFGETAPMLKKTAKEWGVENIYMFATMEEAVKKSFTKVKRGDAILLSPACASWDQFDNYADRGNKFKEIVENLTRS